MRSEPSVDFGGGASFDFVDVALGVAVDDRQSLGGGVLGHELAVLAAKRFTKADRRVAAEVRQPFAFFFAHVVVVG